MELIILIIIGVAIFYIVKQSKKKNVRPNSPLIGLKTSKSEKKSLLINDSILNSPSSLVSQKSQYSEKLNPTNRPINSVSIQNTAQRTMQNQSINNDSEDNLVTFTISVGQSEQKSSNNSKRPLNPMPIF